MSSNILGIGNDIIEVDRIRDSHKEHGDHFLDRILTPAEKEYCLSYKDPNPHLAGRFAAKEAIAKALGTGLGASLSWLDIEILPDDTGKPIPMLSAAAAKHFNNPNILLSISHTRAFATAFALIQ